MPGPINVSHSAHATTHFRHAGWRPKDLRRLAQLCRIPRVHVVRTTVVGLVLRLGQQLITVVNLKLLAAFHQAGIVIRQTLWRRHDAPLDPEQEVELEQEQLPETDAADTRVEGVGPERVAEALCGDRRRRDEEAVHRQRVNREGGVQQAQSVDVENHAQQDRCRQRRMQRQP